MEREYVIGFDFYFQSKSGIIVPVSLSIWHWWWWTWQRPYTSMKPTHSFTCVERFSLTNCTEVTSSLRGTAIKASLFCVCLNNALPSTFLKHSNRMCELVYSTCRYEVLYTRLLSVLIWHNIQSQATQYKLQKNPLGGSKDCESVDQMVLSDSMDHQSQAQTDHL